MGDIVQIRHVYRLWLTYSHLPNMEHLWIDLFALYRPYLSYFDGYASIAKPLTDLTSKHHPNVLVWRGLEQRTFDALRQRVCESPVIAAPILGGPLQLYSDASAVAINCQLTQC